MCQLQKEVQKYLILVFSSKEYMAAFKGYFYKLSLPPPPTWHQKHQHYNGKEQAWKLGYPGHAPGFHSNFLLYFFLGLSVLMHKKTNRLKDKELFQLSLISLIYEIENGQTKRTYNNTGVPICQVLITKLNFNLLYLSEKHKHSLIQLSL